MVIDNAACIGCNACVVACQAENNVPVVGPAEIAEGRDMHWLRVDDYVVDGRPGFSPTPCMHCEHAPCEPVCPVAARFMTARDLTCRSTIAASVRASANPIVHTRSVASISSVTPTVKNTASFSEDIVKAVFNPNVTVRGRGVMEKCTYCVQRISSARRAAEKQHRRIADGEVITACQAACPTRAISFGDLSDPKARINGLRNEAQATRSSAS